MTEESPRIAADWFDGRSGRPHAVQVWIEGGALQLGGQSIPLAGLTWPERQRHGQRQLLLPAGGVLSFADGAVFDAWASASGRRDSTVVRWQQSWRLALLSLALLAVGLAAGWVWVLPWGAAQAAAVVPAATEANIGRSALRRLDNGLLQPSKLAAEQQQRWVQRFAQMMVRAGADPAVMLPQHYELHFRDGGKALGANAFALPGGDIVVTDLLLQQLADEPDAVLTIIGHELGHVRYRHGLRMAMHAGVVGVAASVFIGDFSALLATAPAVISSNAYSRDNEREADAYGRALARSAGVDTSRIAVFFERTAAEHKDDGPRLPIAFSTHPPSAERIAFFAKN